MNPTDIVRQRLHNQHLTGTSFENPTDVVKWLGAVQSQDYGGAKWALGLRSQGIADDDLDQAFNEGKIIRTHVMRPTWHFVDPVDIRWLLELTAPRVHAYNAYYYRQLELDDALIQRSKATIVNALQGGNYLTRSELGERLQDIGVTADGVRLAYLIGFSELDGIICSGPRKGKQFTYALLDERAPQTKRLEREEALAKLTQRYFTSHGPATIQDFAWWSGLTIADTKMGIEMVKSQLGNEVIDGQTYWFTASMSTAPIQDAVTTLHMLPNYDEYTVAYKDRSAIYDPRNDQYLDARGNFLFNHALVIDGRVRGSWKRTFKKGAALLEFAPFMPLREAEKEALEIESRRYGAFLKMPTIVR
ncbi:MAG: winged helix DNA-binding domain-containing protein [Chloroflexota bacterium]